MKIGRKGVRVPASELAALPGRLLEQAAVSELEAVPDRLREREQAA